MKGADEVTEHQRWFWRMTEKQRERRSDANYDWLLNMFASIRRKDPIGLARWQFAHAMKIFEEQMNAD